MAERRFTKEQIEFCNRIEDEVCGPLADWCRNMIAHGFSLDQIKERILKAGEAIGRK